MKSSFFLGGLAACLATVNALAKVQDGLTTLIETRGCATGLHMIVGGGCKTPCAYDANNMLQNLISGIGNAVPGSDEYLVPYDNSSAYFQIVEATNLMTAHAKNYSATCPRTPMVFIGYSLGGIIVMDTICGIGPNYQKQVIGVISYGEETFKYPEPYDFGTCTSNAPNNGARGNVTGCLQYGGVIRDYCDYMDNECCGTGTNHTAHFEYPGLYDNTNIAYIKSQYQSYRNGTFKGAGVAA